MPLATLHSAEEWVARFGETRAPSAVTIGNFDGVHLGHQEILRGVAGRARRENLMAAALTFYPHPAKVLRPAQAPSLLMTLDQRLAALSAMELDAALVLRFDEQLSKLSPDEFVRRFLVETMRARAVLVGENFRFGHRHAGDVKLLGDLGRECGFETEIVQPVAREGAVISSTAIRQSLREGQVETAHHMLGRPFALEGQIKTGTGQGRKLVVPTLNLSTEQETLPKNGVYATETVLGEKSYRSVTNVGVRPTFDGAKLAIESHLFGFSELITSGAMEVRFYGRLRDERKFPNPAALREQVLKDIHQGREFFQRMDEGAGLS